MEKQEIHAFIESLGMTYKTLFVPFKQSRNAKEKHVSLNWLVMIEKNSQVITTDYMQGIAHLPNYTQALSNNAMYADYLRECANTGKYAKNVKNRESFFRGAGYPLVNIPAPELTDVLYSLMMDSDALNYSSFEDWAENLGYDKDSRTAEKIYKSCLEIALKMRAMLGPDTLERLREVFQDY